MATIRDLTAVIEREDDVYVALCPEPEIAGQRSTVEESQRDLREALEHFLEVASPLEVQERLHSDSMRSDALRRVDL